MHRRVDASRAPEPARRLYLAGARVLDVFQVGVVQGNIGISVGVLSYAGHLDAAIVSDARGVPDLDVFARGMSETLARLGAPPVGQPVGVTDRPGTRDEAPRR